MSSKTKVLVLGSLAFDLIMGFEENFINATMIDHERETYQSTITANSRIQYFGGTAGNIAYNLGLLDIAHVSLVGAVGKDFDGLGYKSHIEQFQKIQLGLDIYEDLFTAACYIVNDVKANQMIVFHGGALDKCADISLKDKIGNPRDYNYAINSTQSIDAMVNFSDQLYDLGISQIFDPGQVTPLFPKDVLADAIKKSKILIGNDFEITQIVKKVEMPIEQLVKSLDAIIITRGEQGSELIYTDEHSKQFNIEIPICIPEKDIVDTTGAGDGYRAGILSGLMLNMTLLDSCRLGSVISSFVIETQGAQTQKYTLIDVRKRFLNTYDYIPGELKLLK